MSNIKIHLKTLFPDVEVYFNVDTDNMTATCPLLDLPESAILIMIGERGYEKLKIEFDYFPYRVKYPYNFIRPNPDHDALNPYLKTLKYGNKNYFIGVIEEYNYTLNMLMCDNLDYSKLGGIYNRVMNLKYRFKKIYDLKDNHITTLNKFREYLIIQYEKFPDMFYYEEAKELVIDIPKIIKKYK
jgi:hypothetical protein